MFLNVHRDGRTAIYITIIRAKVQKVRIPTKCQKVIHGAQANRYSCIVAYSTVMMDRKFIMDSIGSDVYSESTRAPSHGMFLCLIICVLFVLGVYYSYFV